MDKQVLSVFYQNCRGLRTKLNTLYMNVLSHNYDIIILTETWLHENISDSEFMDARYRVFRCDRDRARSGRCDGGGVLVAVRRELGATLRARTAAMSSAHSPLVDHILIELRSRTYCCVISAVYIPPNLNSDIYLTHFDSLFDELQSADVNDFVIIGDYNLPSIEWRDCGTHLEPVSSTNDCITNKQLINLMSFLNGRQINRCRNARNRVLDLFITNIREATTAPSLLPLVLPDDHHPPFYGLLPTNKYSSKLAAQPKTQFHYNRANFDNINRDILEIDWSTFLGAEAETAVSLFYEKIYNIIKNHVPCRNKKPSHYPVWFTTPLIHIFKNKNNAWIKWKKYKNVSDYEVFALYRTRFKVESKKCYQNYINLVESSIHDNVNYFWTYINNMKSRADIPSSMSYKNVTADDPRDVCQLFSKFFESVFELNCVPANYDIDNIPNNNHTLELNLNHIEISRESVLKELRTLDISKGPGVDNIPPVFFRSTAQTIYIPIHYLFELCLQQGVFPNIWKSARIVPVFKGGNKSSVEDYRPISILSALSKLFERLVQKSIYPSIHNNIIEQQHGFVKRRSTTTNLLVYATYLFEGIDSNKQIDSVYTDFRKAFDRVDHKLLLDKLAYNGIRGDLWRWFKSYITNRTQKVIINGFESDLVTISSGVPQGSILGPMLFILFINDISHCFKFCNYLLYADDLKIYHVIDNPSDCVKFQSDLDRFSLYCIENKLSLSINKCKSIKFSKKKQTIKYIYQINNIQLETVDLIRDLGITLDTKLQLNTHVDNIINKSFKMYGFVMRSSAKFTRPSTFVCLYKALIRSQLEYAVPIWNPLYTKYVEAIERVQRKFLKSVHHKCFHSRLPYEQLLIKYRLLKLDQRRVQLEAMMLYDLCHNRYDCIPLVNKLCYRIPTRTHSRKPCRLFATTCCRTNAGKRSPMYRLVESYNKTFNTIDIAATRPSIFKKNILDILCNYI